MLRLLLIMALRIILLSLIISASVFGQADLQNMVAAEHAFAAMAAEKGTRAAFLANMSDDAVIFNPDRSNAKEFWTARKDSPSLLSWAPNYADISSNGILGFTTGNWEFRAKGKTDEASAFGEFITVWVRQPDSKYMWVVDIGVGHSKPDKFSTDWSTSSEKRKEGDVNAANAADNANGFYAILAKDGLKKAFSEYAAEDIRLYREDSPPILGKKAAITLLGKEKGIFSMAKRSTFFGSADIAYNLNTYVRTVDGKVVEKGNTMQIWKSIGGKWRIVLDIFKPVPAK